MLVTALLLTAESRPNPDFLQWGMIKRTMVHVEYTTEALSAIKTKRLLTRAIIWINLWEMMPSENSQS